MPNVVKNIEKNLQLLDAMTFTLTREMWQEIKKDLREQGKSWQPSHEDD